MDLELMVLCLDHVCAAENQYLLYELTEDCDEVSSLSVLCKVSPIERDDGYMCVESIPSSLARSMLF
jgi:hypothetical protein